MPPRAAPPLPLLLVLAVALTAPGAIAAEPRPAAPAIDDLVAAVVASHPELAYYRAELEAARADARGAASRPPPELTVQAGRQRVRDSAGALAGEGTAWSVSLAQTFEWPGRLALRQALANRDVAFAELGLARFQAALAVRARTLAYGLAAAQEKAEAAAEVAARFRALRETFLAREPAGIAPLLETRVIEAQELVLQRRATGVQLALQAELAELNQLRGLPPDTPLTVARATPAFAVPPALPELLAAAREHHFDFRARRLEVERQGFAVQLARQEGRPSFTVSPYVSRETADGRDTTVGLGVTVPLPTGARPRAVADAAEARRRQAEAALQAAARAMELEIAQAAREFATRRAEAAQWAPDSAGRFRTAAADADRHYRLGAVPLATYVSLQTAYLDAVDALLDTQREALAAGLRLQLLTGLDFKAVAFVP